MRGKNEDETAAPYAQGLLEVAQEHGVADNVYNDLQRLQGMLAAPKPSGDNEDPPMNELRSFLFNPLETEGRKEVVDSLGKEYKLQDETVNTLKVLIDNNRLECIEELVDVYERVYNETTDTKIITLYSAARMEQEQEFEIARQLQEVTKSKNIKIKPVIDEDLLGGFIVQYGDNRVDLSLRGHLERIKADLTAQDAAQDDDDEAPVEPGVEQPTAAA